MEKKRTLLYYKNYFIDFYASQNTQIREKIDWVLDLIIYIERIPEQYLKHITGTNGLYEIRVQTGNNAIRIFCFFDKGNIIVLGHGFQKKTEKTPPKEIERAEKIKQAYYEENVSHNS